MYVTCKFLKQVTHVYMKGWGHYDFSNVCKIIKSFPEENIEFLTDGKTIPP